MPQTTQTLGTVEADREVDALWAAIKAVGTNSAAPPSAPVQRITVSNQSQISAQTSDGVTALVGVDGIEIDVSAGLALSLDGTLGKISRIADIATPKASGTGAAGSGAPASNNDHVHPFSVSGGLASYNSSTGALVVNVPMLGADPGSPAAGDMWYRTDTNQLCVYTGSATKRSGAFA